MKIIIAKDFTDLPGPRYKSQREFSGEAFRDDILIPKIREAITNNEKLTINFDGTFGYPSSFLKEAFGGLNQIYDEETILKTLEFISGDEPALINEVKNYIKSNKKQNSINNDSSFCRKKKHNF